MVTNLPPGVTFSTSAGVQLQARRTTQRRALRHHKNTSRRAAAFTAKDILTVDLGFLDGALHRLALYFVDWEKTTARAQFVEVIDGETGALLDSRSVSNFAQGVYLTYLVRGSIRIRITGLSGGDPVLSGIFLDAPNTEVASVQIVAPSLDQQFISPATVLVSASTSGIQEIESIEFLANGVSFGRDTSPPFQMAWPLMSPGSHVLVARAMDRLGVVTDSKPVRVRASLPSAVVGLERTDTITRGHWMENYGSEGFAIPGYMTNLPAYGAVNFGTNYVRVYFPGYTSRELETAGGNGQILSIWRISGPTDFQFLDGQEHLLSLYFVDVEQNHEQTMSFRNGDTGETLFSTILPPFGDGLYYVFRVRGHVRLELASEWGAVGILSGLFLDSLHSAADKTTRSVQMPQLQVINGQMTLIIRQHDVKSDGSFVLEVSEDLKTWRPAGHEWIEKERRASGRAHERVFQSTQSVTGRERLFIRLRSAE
jgi:hypothetical protein